MIRRGVKDAEPCYLAPGTAHGSELTNALHMACTEPAL